MQLDQDPVGLPYRRAAQYLRMSTERQDYSIRNQAEALQQYAAANDMLIVRTYADEGRSGLTIEGRAALTQLIEDVQTGLADFEVLLVFDVSRWGRFQDADEGAFYEYLCRRAGIQVIYCGEVFAADGSAMATIVKAMKRVMAGEYSRELSAKIFAGQANLARRGFKQGGPAPFGLRRMVIDKDGAPRALLSRGQMKAFQSDRIILVPGPPEEVRLVERMFRDYAAGKPLKHIAEEMQAEGVPRLCGGKWTCCGVRDLLENPAYVGECVYNRASFKLKRQLVQNPPSDWIRMPGAYEAIIDQALFDQVQRRLAQSRAAWHSFRARSADQVLADLQGVLEFSGELTVKSIGESGLNWEFYRKRFGGIPQVRKLLGASRPEDVSYALRPMRNSRREGLIDKLRSGFTGAGSAVEDALRGELVINGSFSLWARVTPCRVSRTGLRTAFINFTPNPSDLVVVECVKWEDQEHLNYLIFEGARAPKNTIQIGRPSSYARHLIGALEPLFALRSRDDLQCLFDERSRRADPATTG